MTAEIAIDVIVAVCLIGLMTFAIRTYLLKGPQRKPKKPAESMFGPVYLE